MTTQDDFWLAMSDGARLVELNRSECLELLAAKQVGRLGFGSAEGPTIMPMNYRLVGAALVVRTVAYGLAGRSVIDQPVAFEVDELDDFLQTGWSVLARGVARLLTVDQVDALRLGGGPTPWAGGPRTLFLEISAEQLSGRRLIAR